MRSWLPFLCSSMVFLGNLACGGPHTPALGPERTLAAGLVGAWESGAELHTDPRRGLLVLRFCEGAEGSAGCEMSAFRHCGDSLRRALAVLREDLQMRQNYAEQTHVYDCAGDECHHSPMMDGDYRGTLRFDMSADPPVLIEVLHVEGPAAPGAVIRWAEGERAEGEGAPHARLCPEGSA